MLNAFADFSHKRVKWLTSTSVDRFLTVPGPGFAVRTTFLVFPYKNGTWQLIVLISVTRITPHPGTRRSIIR